MLTFPLRFVFLITISIFVVPSSYAEKKSSKSGKTNSLEPDCDEIVHSSGSSDPVNAYIRDIGKYAVLSHEELIAKHTALYEQEYKIWELLRSSPFISQFSRAWNDYFKERPLNEKETESDSDSELDGEETGERLTSKQKAAQQTPEQTLADLNRKMERIRLVHGHVRTVLSIALRETENLRKTADAEHKNHLDLLGSGLKEVIKLNLAYRNEVALGNIRLAFDIAKRNMNRPGVKLADLIQLANEGLLTAADRFDPERGWRFSTYANWWFKQAVVRNTINEGYTIRVPVHMRELIAKVAGTYQQLRGKLGQVPTVEDVAIHLEIPIERVERALQVVIQDKTSSLDSPTAMGDGDDKLADYVPDSEAIEAGSAIEKERNEDLARDVLKVLTPLEREVIERHFGLVAGKSGEGETLREIGESHSLSRERIRQLEVRALNKLRLAVAERHQDLSTLLAPMIAEQQKKITKKKKKKTR